MESSAAPALANLAAEHGTPLYVYDWRIIKARIDANDIPGARAQLK